MRKIYWLMIPLLFLSCQNNTIEISGINLKKWKEDKNACLGYREKSIEILQKVKNDLLKKSEVEIIAAFGKPNKAELIEKSQKIYAYYLNKNNQNCEIDSINSQITKTLQIRFNSTGYANSILVIN